jgi:outer membrane protein assembly factor BamB
MSRVTSLIIALLATIAALALAAGPALGAGNVTTAAYNNLRDNWDPGEPALSPAEVQSSTFGQLFSTKLKGAVYAQPLVYDNTVIVTTEEAYAYGINPATGAIVWSRSFGKPFKASTIGCSDLQPYIGSTSTPVIDSETGTVYLTTRLQTGKGLAGGHWYLQALSATTGAEKPGFPVPIQGTPYNTPGVPFNESFQMQRPALLLLNGVVYVAFASDCDITPYRGIVVGMSAESGAITTMWSDESGVGTEENSQAGIWQSGGGLVSDIPGRIILATGNGVSPSPAPSNKPPATLSESVLGLTVAGNGQIAPSQFFAPSDAPELDHNDEDLGSGGPIALPTETFGTKAHPHLVVEVGKDGRIFLIDADNMGGYQQGPGGGNAVLQELGPFNGVWGHPAAYGGQGGWVYVLESSGGGYLRALSYGLSGTGLPQLSSAGTSSESFGYTSGSPLVTSNGTTPGSAVVWVVYASGSTESGAGGQLRAYSATPTEGNLALLWSGKIGKSSKFAVPTAYEGRVYVGTRNGRLLAFGSSADAPVLAQGVALGAVPVGESRTLEVPISTLRRLSFTAAVSAQGVERVPGPAQAVALALAKGSHTAGPSVIEPSGTSPLAHGVITIHQPQLGRALPAGATVRVKLSFTPAHAGPVVGELTIPTSAGERAVPISGYGTSPGLIASAPPLDFDTIQTDAGGRRLSITFANSWSRPERLTSFVLPRGPYSVSGLPAAGTVLAPRQSVTVSVWFNPRRAGSYPARLTVTTDHGALSVAISGAAQTGVAHLSVSARRLDFGAVAVGHTKLATLTVSNTGTVPLTITRAIAPLEPFYAPVQLPEGISLAPGEKAHIRVAFRPNSSGTALGTYRFNSTDGRGPIAVTLSGRGV